MGKVIFEFDDVEENSDIEDELDRCLSEIKYLLN